MTRERLASTDYPAHLLEAQRLFTALLAQEREIWVHMVLYARTGQELHRVLVDELVFANSRDMQDAVRHLQALVGDASVDPGGLGLNTFVDAEVTPTRALSASPTPSPAPTLMPTPTNTPTPRATGTPAPLPTPTTKLEYAKTASPTPTRITPTPTPHLPQPTEPPPSPSATPTIASTPTPTPTSAPLPETPSSTIEPVLTEGALQVIRFKDRKGEPALVAHWTVDVEPESLSIIEYPFLDGDQLEFQLAMGCYTETCNPVRIFMEAPNGERLFYLEELSSSWLGLADTVGDGTYRVYFDNTFSDEPQIVHFIVIYHMPAPGSKLLG